MVVLQESETKPLSDPSSVSVISKVQISDSLVTGKPVESKKAAKKVDINKKQKTEFAISPEVQAEMEAEALSSLSKVPDDSSRKLPMWMTDEERFKKV